VFDETWLCRDVVIKNMHVLSWALYMDSLLWQYC